MAISQQQWDAMSPVTRDRLTGSGYSQIGGNYVPGGIYEQNPNVTWSYGGQTTVNPLDRGQFLTQGAAQNLAGQLGQGYQNNAWQLGGPAAYSAPMQTINNLHNAGLVQQMVDRGIPIDQVRSQLDREAAMARGGTQTTLNNPGQAQSESERMYQSMGLVRGADGQWRTPQNAQQTGAANGPPQASPSQQQRYGPLVSAMQQERLRPGYERMGGTNMDGPRPNNSNAAMPQIDWAQRMQNPNFGRNELYGGGQAMSDPGEQRGVDMGMSGSYGTPEQMSSNLGAAMNRYGQQQQQRWNSMSPEQQQQEISQMNSNVLTGQGSMLTGQPGVGWGINISSREGGMDGRGWTPNPSYGMAGNMDSASSAMRNQPYLPNGGQTPFRNAMFGQRLEQYGQGMAGYGSNILFGEGGSGDERGPSPFFSRYLESQQQQPMGMGQTQAYPSDQDSGSSRPRSQFPSMQQVRGGQANNLGYDPYYYGPQARGPQARQPGWQYPQNTGAFQLYNHGSQESNDLSSFNQRMQQQEQASMPAAWRTAQNAGRGGGGGSWDWNQGARAY